MPTSPAKFILAIDQGTSGTSASLYDLAGGRVAHADAPLASTSPSPGWVEQHPRAILDSVHFSVRRVLDRLNVQPAQVLAVALANQGESLLLWDTATGEPLYNLIGWQCTRSVPLCQRLIAGGYAPEFTRRTGLHIHPEWPATKIPWLLENVPHLRQLRDRSRLAFSAGDSWLLYHLTRGERFITDHATASRTGIYNLHTRTWDHDLLRLFQAEGLALPVIVDNSGDFGALDLGDGLRFPLYGLILDQASALLGHSPLHADFDPPARAPSQPAAKITYGTCVALWCSVGSAPVDAGLLDCSLAWQLEGHPTYACTGEADLGASVLTWLRDNFVMPWEDGDLSAIARSAHGNDELVFVPALKGLDAPHGIPQARGALFGMDTTTSLAHLLRAALESIAFTARDLLESLPLHARLHPQQAIHADGGMTANDYLMQFQADILSRPVCLADDLEATSRGAALLAAYALGILPQFTSHQELGRVLTPRMGTAESLRRYAGWQNAIANVIGYARSSSEEIP